MSTALVTGGTGFIALYVVKQLLERGQDVHTTVRSLKKPKKLQPLLDLQAHHPGKLTLFEADLMRSGSFLESMQGCDIVYHIASPFLVPQQIKDGLKECVEPALQGARTVLQSVEEVSSVKRVVLTSSIVSLYGDASEILHMPGGTLTEATWNETSTVSSNPYAYSKVMAEREAWKLHDAQPTKRWDLIAINPGLVVGPSLSPDSISGSLYMLESMYRGDNKIGAPKLHYPVADVRDVAHAHVLAGTNPAAKGRYLIANSGPSTSILDMANAVRPIAEQPKLLPRKNLLKLMVYAAGPFVGVSMAFVRNNVGVDFKVDGGKSERELGLEYRSVETMVRDHYTEWAKNQKKAKA